MKTAYRSKKWRKYFCGRLCAMTNLRKSGRIGINWENRKLKQRQWRQKNSARIKQSKILYYQQNKEAIIERVRVWRKSHPDARYTEKQVRRAKVRRVTITPVSRAAIFNRDKGRCQLCGLRVRKSEISMDHIIPISLGGPHEPRNVQLAHVRCNVRRGAGRTPAQMRIF